MKNAIILSCSTGQGHNSCAEALKEYFEEKNIRCDIVDALRFVSPGFSVLVSWGHSFMYRHIPWFFRWGYRYSEHHPGFLGKKSLVHKLLSKGAARLREHINEGGYDTVICTHVFPTLILSEACGGDYTGLTTAFVATDYTCCPGMEDCGLEWMFIPCESPEGVYRDRSSFLRRAVVTGIPVRREFWERMEKDEAKRRLNIGAGRRHLLLMCGSMGCGPIVKVLRSLVRRLPENLEITVICGTNGRLREKLERRYSGIDRVRVLGYTDDISLYMDSADLYLTKPGGISVTEAAAKGLPMAFIDAVSGCERYNMDFFTGMGAAVTDSSVEGLAEKCLKLLSSEGELSRMRSALEDYRQPNGAELIFYQLTKGPGNAEK